MATIRFKRGSTDPVVGIGPTGLTAGEPAFNSTDNKFFIHNGTTAIWVGAEIENTNANWSDGTVVPTKNAVNELVNGAISGGGNLVNSVNGATGDVIIADSGPGLLVDTNNKVIAITNTGVTGLTLSAASSKGLSISGAGTTGELTKSISLDFANANALVGATLTDKFFIGDASNSDAISYIQIGTALNMISGDITVNATTGVAAIGSGVIVDADINASAAIATSKLAANTISGVALGNNLNALTIGSGLGGAASYNGSSAVTITNEGVRSLTGTANEIEVSGTTGDITIGLPDNVTVGGNLSVVGNFTVNGTTTTVNSTIVAIQDPIFTLGGTAALSSDDNKDRGIEFRWHNGSSAKTGFFGFNDDVQRFTFIPDATNSSEVFSGTVGDIQIASAYLANGANLGQVVPTTLSENRTYTLPDHTGTVVVPTNLGTSNYILKANGTSSQPTWIDATAAGFTAYNATNVTSVEASGTYYLAMASAVGTNQLALDTTATALTYNTATSTLTAGTFSGTLSGNASSATNATNATNVISTEQTTGTMYLVGMAAAGTTGALLIDATAQGGLAALSYNNATATLTAYQVEAIVDGGSY